MTLEQLETFKAVVQEGSFRAAADKLWKTQPAVSISIKKLEVEFGLTFFDRKNYRGKLTAEGEVFYERVQLLLSEAGQLKQLGNYLGEGHEAFLRLAINIISPLSGLLHFLRHFFEDYCNTQLDLQFEVLHGAIEKLLNDEVDIAIAVMLESDAALDSHFLCESRMIPLAAPGVFEIDSAGFVSDKQLKKHIHILVSDTAKEKSNKKYNVLDGGRQWTVSDMNVKKELMLAGLGWGTLPEYLVKSELDAGRLIKFKSHQIKDFVARICAFRKKNAVHGPVAKKLWEGLQVLPDLSDFPR